MCQHLYRLTIIAITASLTACSPNPNRAEHTHGETNMGGQASQTTFSLKSDEISIPDGKWWDDSFSQAIVAVAQTQGVDADYIDVHRLSTNMFAPAMNDYESCSAWWHWYGRDVAIDHVGAALGLSFEKLDLPKCQKWSKEIAGEWDTIRAAHRAECAPILHTALQAGKPILAFEGWDSGEEGVFIPWCQWGIIHTVDQDATIKGITRGRDESLYTFVGPCYAVTKTKTKLTQPQVDSQTLKLASQRIRAEGAFASKGDVHHGVAAMDRWIHRMTTIPGFCESCYTDGAAMVCAKSCADRMILASQQAAEQLRKMAADASPDAKPHLETAAESYQRIVDLFGPAVDNDNPNSYAKTKGNIEAQAKHADTLQMVKAELLKAADAMERAVIEQTP